MRSTQNCLLLLPDTGVAKYGNPVGLSQEGLKVDMIVVGSSAVSRNGARLGKGEVSSLIYHDTHVPQQPQLYTSLLSSQQEWSKTRQGRGRKQPS